MEENIVLTVEDYPGWCIETNIGWEKDPGKWCADIWDERKLDMEESFLLKRPFVPAKLVKSFSGEHCLTDAVLFLSEILGDYVAHRIRRAQ